MVKTKLLNALINQVGNDDKITVAELKTQLQVEINEDINSQIDEDKKVLAKYNGKFLKLTNGIQHGGNTVDIIQVEEIEPNSFTQDWERTFTIKGNKLHFNEHLMMKKQLTDMASFTVSELDKYEEITEDEFYDHDEKIKKFRELLVSVGIKKLVDEEV